MPGGVELHQGAHDQAVFLGLQRAHPIRKSFGEHGDSAVREIDGGAAEPRLLIEVRADSHVMRDVGDVHLEAPAAASAAFDVDGVVEVARGFAVDRDDWQTAKIFATLELDFADGLRAELRLVQNFGGEGIREMMLADDNFRIDAEFARPAQNFDHAAGGGRALAGVAQQFDVYHRSVKLLQMRYAPHPQTGFIRAAEPKFLRQSRGQLVAARDFHFVLNANVVGQNHIAARAVTK